MNTRQEHLEGREVNVEASQWRKRCGEPYVEGCGGLDVEGSLLAW